PDNVHDVGPVRAVPSRCVRRTDHRVRRARRVVTAGNVTTYWCELAWLGDVAGAVEQGVAVTVDGDRIAAVETGAGQAGADVRLAGLTIPGIANGHSHAFHR